MKKLLVAILVVGLALGGCAKKVVKDQSGAKPGSSAAASAPAAAPVVEAPATSGGAGSSADAAAGAAAAGAAAASQGGGAQSGADAKGAAGSTGATGAAAGAAGGAAGSDSAAAAAGAGAAGAAGGAASDSGAEAAPGKVAAAQQLEGLPSAAQSGGASVKPPKDAAGGLAQRSIYFDFDSNEIAAEYLPIIEAHAKFLVDHPTARVIVQGNTDERGSSEYNLALGQRRSDSVRRRMSLLGVQDSQIESVSFGKEKPRNPGHDETAWHENRRADIVYRGE